MQPTFRPRSLRRLILISAITAGFVAGRMAAAESTKMPPYKVEAEFGVDGLRIQNSSSVLNQYLLEQHGVGQLQEISGIAPNLFTSNSDSRGFGDVLVLRGLANSLFFSAPSVALYVDDVPSGSVSSYPSALLTVDSLVVKAGPQGTGYGRNAPGGVIEIQTRTPGAIPRGTLQLDYGSFGARSFQAAVDGPLSSNLGYSATFGHAARDGYIENTFLGRSADDRRSIAGRGALHWKIDDTLRLRFGMLAERVEDDAPRLTSLFSPERWRVASDLNGETRIDRLQLSFQARKTLPWGSITATTSRQKWELDPASTDLDLSPMPLAWSRMVQDEEVWTQEVRVESTPDAASAQWRAGLFYFDSTNAGDAQREFVVPPGDFVPPGFVQTERTQFEIGQRSVAGYANLEQPFTERSTLQLGLRLERAASELARTKASANNFGFPSPQDAPLAQSQAGVRVSASAGVVHAVSESLSVLLRSAIGRRPEGYSAFTGDPQLTRFAGERSWANEVGVTFSPPQGRFGGSLLGFWNDVEDYQLERTVPNSTDFVVINARQVRSRGLEAKFMWNPLERVWWDFQAGYTEATFDEHHDATGASVAGNRVPFVPKYTLRTGVTMDFGHGISATASYASIGESFFDERNTAMFAQPTHGIVNAQVHCRFDRWVATVYGHNLADKYYYQFINPEIFAGSPGAPRRFGVQLAYEY